MARTNDSATTFERLEGSLRKKQFEPLYLFCGEEDFLIDEIVDILMEEALDESTRSFNLDVLYGSDVDAKNIVSIASSFPMMSERRIVVVREFDKTSNKDILTSYVEHPSPSTSLALISSRPDFRQKIYKSLKEHATVGEFKQLYENEIPQWINKRIRVMGKSANMEACQLIQNYVGRSLREIQNEIEKMFIYVGEKKILDVEDVHRVVGLSRQHNIFELQNALGAQNIGRALEILQNLLQSGESPVGMIVMLTRYFQKLWLAQELLAKNIAEGQIASALGTSPFFAKEYVAAARKFPTNRLTQCFAALLEADEMLKSSRMENSIIMTLLIHKLVRGERSAAVAG
jgi:DNA polymerase-3 subunit delta